jgi:hypothetical protein
MTDFACGDCDYSTADFDEGVGHATEMGHELTRTVDDEGTMMTISVVYEDEDEWGDEL